MVRTNIQYRLTLYLEGRARADRAGTCDALSVDNVPAYFPYLVFGQEWIAAHEGQCRYNVSTSMHEISGSCEDMVPLTGTSCKTTCVGLNRLLHLIPPQSSSVQQNPHATVEH